MIQDIVKSFGLDPSQFTIERTGSGHINQTYKVEGTSAYILQRINNKVFTRPELIATNLRLAADYLAKHYPDYLFLSGIKAKDGSEMVYDAEGFPWRLFPYIHNTITVDKVETAAEAHAAASGFARLARNLSACDPAKFRPTIDRFHDLAWRFEQFETALKNTTEERKAEAKDAIDIALYFGYLVKQYNDLISKGGLQLRVTHNDTKINNILFDATTRDVVCVIDLDTLMPGYFIYDLGDMIRTFVSPVSEEEKDLSQVVFRRPMYDALLDGYFSEMSDSLNSTERTLAPFAGMMMTYIMAIRMLADFLNGNVYYHITYPEQNLVRASNQLRLLQLLEKNLTGVGG
jgi:Ser/Thr protein kinase RdoA (MazF antagonist)